MASVNKVILIGNLGRDPEVRYTPSGVAVCSLPLATTRAWKSRDGGERQEETEWHRIVLYERLAEVAGEYLRKGRQVYIEGRLRTRKWQGQDGKDNYITEIIAEHLQMLGSRDSGEDGDGGRARPAAAPAPAPRPVGRAAPKAPPTSFDDMDDDIPF